MCFSGPNTNMNVTMNGGNGGACCFALPCVPILFSDICNINNVHFSLWHTMCAQIDGWADCPTHCTCQSRDFGTWGLPAQQSWCIGNCWCSSQESRQFRTSEGSGNFLKEGKFLFRLERKILHARMGKLCWVWHVMLGREGCSHDWIQAINCLAWQWTCQHLYVCGCQLTGSNWKYMKKNPKQKHKIESKKIGCPCHLLIKIYPHTSIILGNYRKAHNHETGATNIKYMGISCKA